MFRRSQRAVDRVNMIFGVCLLYLSIFTMSKYGIIEVASDPSGDFSGITVVCLTPSDQMVFCLYFIFLGCA